MAYKMNVLTALETNAVEAIPPTSEVNHHLQLQELKKATEQATKVSEQLRIQALSRNKFGMKKEQLVKDGTDLTAIYQTSIQLNTTQQLIERYEAKATHLDQQLTALLRETFPHAKDNLLKKLDALPLEMKTDLLKHFIENAKPAKNVSLKACLQVAKKEQSKRTMS
ncbi:hypothetical protein, partial [Streptomyces sp. NPDC046876]|uniref:hypothetical protein n=1 Tax=Streptomyces sp. NPDC046876 TaxID=3155616 RepID=UPI0033F7C6A7